MPVHLRDLERLARLLEIRLPSYDDRISVATRAGLASEVQATGDALEAWRDILVTASEKDRLLELLRILSRALPDERYIQVLLGRLGAPEGARSLARTLLVGALILALLSLLLVFLFRAPQEQAPEPETPGASSTQPLAPLEPPALVVPADPPAPPPQEAAAEPPPDKPPQEPPREPAPLPAEKSSISGNCRAPMGQLVGYWYAAERPGGPGEIITLEQGANVRQDYPRRENSWNARAPFVCGLLAGTQLRLSQEPIRMPRGDWWVPIQGGDVR